LLRGQSAGRAKRVDNSRERATKLSPDPLKAKEKDLNIVKVYDVLETQKEKI
jgi:hypothetical protein